VINGRVLFGTNGLSGVSVSIGTNVSLVTDPTGSFATALNPGTYVVTPSLTNYAFAPGSILVTIPPDATGLNFTGVVAYAISGQVVDQSSNGLAGVTVMADTNSAVTGPNGNYTIPSVRPGTYFVSASGSNQVFTPSSQQVDVSNFVSGINFALAYQVSFISGRVTQNGAGLPNVKIVTGGSGSTTTDFDGNYALTVKDGTYIVTPQLSGVAFSPSSSVVTVPPAAVGIDFVAGTVITFITNTPSGTVQITVIGPRGQVNWVEASTNLVDWIVISTNTTPFTFTDSKAVNFTSRFYRTLVK
jgi:hypothetical protein